MNILFVSSGNSGDISPIIKIQSFFLKKEKINIFFFSIKGKGLMGYLSSIRKLNKFLNRTPIDIVHAHYAFSGYLVSFLKKKYPLVVSLMGSDVFEKKIYKYSIKWYCKYKWDITIAKSVRIKKYLGIKNLYVIPNGVDVNYFNPKNKIKLRHQLGWDIEKKYILFGSDPKRKEKNYSLFQKAMLLIKEYQCQIKYLNNLSLKEVLYYLNASDILVLTSLWEGSPNVIKEAMACNTPIVSTDVGDVKWVIENIDGCYITSNNPKDLASKIVKALFFSDKIGKTNGRERILELGLDSETITTKLKSIYVNALNEKK